MRVTRLTDNLIALNRYRFVNCYLVREDDGFTLVDASLPGGAERFIAAAAEHGGEIKRVALTHGHSDHTGSLDTLDGLIDGLEVLIPELDMRVLDGEREWEGRKVKGGWPNLQTRPTVRLKPGDRVGSLEVVGTTGHTPGHVSFIDTRDGSCVCGDVASTLGGLAISSHVNPRFPLIYMGTWNPARDVDSAEALADRQPTLLAPGHGSALPNPVPDLRIAIERARRALK